MQAIPITLRQIDYVIAAGEYGSTAAAARMLNVSQPSVSLAIAKVEAHFGRALFSRNQGSAITPTAFGAEKLGALRSLQTQATLALDPDATGSARLTLGVFSTLGPRYAPALIRGFQKIAPQTRINLVEGDLAQLTHWLGMGQIDMALIYDFDLPSSLHIAPLKDVRPYALVSGRHRLAEAATVTLAELLRDPLVLMNLPHSREYFLTLARMHNIRPRIAYETASLEMLRSMVANQMGVGLVATDINQTTACDGQTVVRLELDGNLAPHRIALATAPHGDDTPHISAFKTYAAQFFRA